MKLFVGSISRRVMERELWDAFEAFGPVESVTIVKDRDTGQARGFAFVDMTNNAQAEAAINALNGMMMGDKAIIVSKARPRDGGIGGGGRGDGGMRRGFHRGRWGGNGGR